MIKSFSKNTLGKDYICADVHGHFQILTAELEKVGFREDLDRLFSLGDLIDRGDGSVDTLDWLAKPWFFAIQGNHERMLINALDTGSDSLRLQWLTYGGDWAKDFSGEEIAPYYDQLSRLPVAIELETVTGNKVGLVHAELPDSCDWLEIVHMLETAKPEDVELNPDIANLLWSRSQMMQGYEKRALIMEVENIDHVFHGHTILNDYLTIKNRTFMDLGSYRTGRVGIIDVEEFLKSKA